MSYIRYTCKELLSINIDNFQSIPICIKGRLYILRNQKNMCFIILRLVNNETIQVVAFKNKISNSDELISLPSESIIDIYGLLKLTSKPVESCSFKNLELEMHSFNVISLSSTLPFLLTDANRETSAVGLNLRMNYPLINIRSIEQNIILRVKSKICEYFRSFLTQNDFVEIHTPKINGNSSEGGSEVFKLKYFDNDAYLAQSPQLYKQMAINSDLNRVFEIGPVFRAEKFSHNRHLCE